MKNFIIALVMIIACAHSAPAQEWHYYTETDAFDGNTHSSVYYIGFTNRGNDFLLRAQCTEVYLRIGGFVALDGRDEIRVIFDDEKPAWYPVLHSEATGKYEDLTFYGKNNQLFGKMEYGNSMKIEVYLHRNERNIIDLSLVGFKTEYAKLRC